MKTTTHLNFSNRRSFRIMPGEVDDLYDVGLPHFARSPRLPVGEAVPAVEHLSFDSWMSGGGLRPYLP